MDVPVMIAQEAIAYLDRRLAAGGLTQVEYEGRIQDGQLREKLERAKKERNECLSRIFGNDSCSSKEELNRTVYIIWSASKVVLEENWVEPLKTVTFEGLNVTTFGRAEEYLKQRYGDSYMELPPDEMRRVGLTKIEW